MNGRNKVARILVTLGAIVLFASTAIHSAAAYPKVSGALSASNLSAPLKAALRAVFLLVGWHWVVIGVVALLAVFRETKLRKILVLFCGVAVLVETGLTLAFIGVFLGNELIGSAALLILCGGLLFQNAAA
jgi:surface polysaccharide O-acyltransferase-like enzyme